MVGIYQVVWRADFYICRGKTTRELDYRKVDGELPGVPIGIKGNQMYLYGNKYMCVVDTRDTVDRRHAPKPTTALYWLPPKRGEKVLF